MFGFFFLIDQYLQFVRGYSPLEAGLALLPFAPHADPRRPAERQARRAVRAERGRRHRLRGMIASASSLFSLLDPDSSYWGSWPG